MSAEIRLGDRCRDLVSGWEGIAVARYTYMNGCERYDIAGHNKDGEPESYVFDVQQIVVIEANAINSVKTPAADLAELLGAPGGDRSNRPVPR